MAVKTLWIRCKPRLYSDLLRVLFGYHDTVHIADLDISAQGNGKGGDANGSVDVIVLSFGQDGNPDLSGVREVYPNTKLVAFSTDDDVGLCINPGQENWRQMRPFGWSELLREVLQG